MGCILWPFTALISLVGGIIGAVLGLIGHIFGFILGLILTIVGAIASVSVVGLIIGIPLILFGIGLLAGSARR